MSIANELNVSIGAEIDGLQKGLDQAGKELTKFEGKVKNLAKVGGQMQKIGGALSVGLTLPLAALGVTAAKTFADFSQGMAKVKAISGATTTEMEALRKSAEDLGSSTRYAATEVAGLQLNLSKLGFDPAAINESTGAILNLALATGEDLAQSAKVAASTIQGFGLKTSEAGRVADVMAKSFSSSALGLQKFQVAMATVAPVAKTANQSLEETTAALSVLVNSGIQASTAGTALRNIFLKLAKSGISMEKAFEDIRKSSNKNATAIEYFGIEGATAAVVLADNADAAKDFAKQYENAEGAAAKMAKIMDNTLTGSLAGLKSATEGAQIAIGEVLAPVIRSIAESLTGLVNRFKDLSPTMQKVVITVGAVAAAAGPLIAILGTFFTLLPGITAGVGALGTAFTVLTGPIGLVVAGIGAIIYAVTKNWDSIKPYIVGTINYFIRLYNESLNLKIAVEGIVFAFKTGFSIIKGMISTTWELFKSFIKGIADSAAGVGTILRGILNRDGEAIVRGANQIRTAQKGLWTDVAKDLGSGVGKILADVKSNFDKSKQDLFGEKKALISDINLFDKGKIKEEEEELQKEVAGIGGRIKAVPLKMEIKPSGIESSKANITTAFTDIKNKYLTESEIAAAEIKIMNDRISEAFSGILSNSISEGLSNTFDGIGRAIAEGGNIIGAIGGSLLGAFSGFLSDMGDMLIKYGTLAIAKGNLDIAIATGGPIAIGAGIAALAVGALLKVAGSALGSASKSGFSGGSSSTGSAGGGGYSTPRSNASSSGGFGGGKVVFEIEGQKLVGVLSRTLDRNSRLASSI